MSYRIDLCACDTRQIIIRGRSNATLSNSVAVPAAPAIGYEPDWQSEDFVVEFGFQVQANVISGTLPSTALDWTEASVS